MTLSRQTLTVIVLFFLSAGCKNHSEKSAPKNTTSHTSNAPQTSIIGSWSGMLGNNKITLFIERMDNGEISGYSVCAGNDRPFKGTYTETETGMNATLKEPGDNKYDGTFDMAISKSPLQIEGKWTPIDPEKQPRQYSLSRKNFKYDTAAGNYTEASTRLLTTDDVENLYKEDLRYMRNEIYARHGYSFKLVEVRSMFDDKDWYMPVSTDVRKRLTAIELKNEQLIKHYEKYAETSYDDFGR
jgi:hypothetical protein